ncbi:MAG: hypothetical protein AB8G22_21770 [Saprospiraceae bacterium]
MKNKLFTFQNIGTLLALCISILALLVSVYEANILKSQQKAMVWPYLKVNPSYGSEGFSLIAVNNGTGPALVKSIELTYDGKQFKTYDELLDYIKPDRKVSYGQLRMRNLNNTVMRAGEVREVFHMAWTAETREMVESASEIEFKIQYASVLNDYWIYDSKTDQHTQRRFKAKIEFQ